MFKYNDRIVFFLHIYKTAGQWMRGWLKLAADEEHLQPTQTVRFRVIESHEQCEEFRFHSVYQDKTQIIGGHLRPSWPEKRLKVTKPYSFITIFRPTVDRIVSSYFYFKRHTGDPTTRPPLLLDSPLDYCIDYLLDLQSQGLTAVTPFSSGGMRLINWMSSSIACPDEDRSTYLFSPSTLWKARDWINTYCSYIAFQDNFQLMHQELPERFDWKRPSDDYLNFYSNKNIHRPKYEVNQTLRDKILRLNWMDEALYQYVLNHQEEINHGKIKWIG